MMIKNMLSTKKELARIKEVWLYQVKSGGFGGQNYKNA